MRAIPLFAALVALAVSASPDSEKISISFENTGTSNLGVFYVGNETRKRLVNPDAMTAEDMPLADYEMLTDVLTRGEFSTHNTHYHHAFELRTADFGFRVKVVMYKNFHREAAHLPYIIMFKNLALERVDNTPVFVELKHSNSGFVWILPAEEAAHASDANHFYELRNADRESVVLMRILHGHHDEL